MAVTPIKDRHENCFPSVYPTMFAFIKKGRQNTSQGVMPSPDLTDQTKQKQCLFYDLHASGVRTQCFGNSYAPILVLVVFHESNETPAYCNSGTVKRVNKAWLGP